MNKGTKKLQRLLKEIKHMTIDEYNDLYRRVNENT